MSGTLYQTLSQNTRSKDISVQQKAKIMEIIPTLTGEEKEALFLLMYEHYRVGKKVTGAVDLQNLELPYKIKETSDGGIEFSLSKIPTKLRQILFKFVQIVENNRLDETKK